MAFWNSLEFKNDFLDLIDKVKGLDLVLEIANQSGVRYALFGGAYVSLATRSRPVTDIDFLTNAYAIRELRQRFPESVLKGSQPGFATQFLCPLGTNLIEFTADIEVYNGKHKYSFFLTDLVWKYTQRVIISVYQLYFVNPLEVILLKAILQRGKDQGKHDLEDIKSLLKFTYINNNYLRQRLIEINADERVINCLAQFGIRVPVEEQTEKEISEATNAE
ncbi:MAG TPA: hypothetical protein VMW41_04280 [Candidatus Bathyarchaeia archaeon]|nr:hypothetical protein [Candidatus Bathyarchaeia archaeon]